MLVLARSVGEKVVITVPPMIGEIRIEVIVTDVGGGQVRLGFAAPRAVSVFRDEIQALRDEEAGS